MKLVFKDPASGDTVGDTNFKEYYPNINLNTFWPNLKPYIDQATRTFVLPFLGKGLYTAVTDYIYAVSPTPDSKMDELIHLLRTSVAYYTIHKALPHIITIISDMGARSSSNNSSQPVDAFAYKNTLWSAIRGADDALDQALAYLWEEKAHLAFAAYQPKKSTWYDTVDDMKQYLNIVGIRAYVAMMPYISRAEDNAKALLCEIYEDIKGKKVAGTLSNVEKGFVDLLKKYMADTSLQYAIPRLSLMIEDDGLKLVSSTDNFSTRSNAIASFGKEGPQAVLNKLAIDEKSARKALFTYMNGHLDDFPIYKEANQNARTSPSPYISPDCIGGIGIM